MPELELGKWKGLIFTEQVFRAQRTFLYMEN